MPTYLVIFDGLVIDQPDNFLMRRATTVLPVHAPSPAQAERHAIRVTTGEAAILRTVLLEEAAPAEVEAAGLILTAPPAVEAALAAAPIDLGGR